MAAIKDSKNLFKFYPGQLVVHKKYGYRGVIFEVDTSFQGTDQDYEEVNTDSAPKNAPWYHVLVDGSDYVTYVAESLLDKDPSEDPIHHPHITQHFKDFKDGKYFRQLH